jgi:hypothetical protein
MKKEFFFLLTALISVLESPTISRADGKPMAPASPGQSGWTNIPLLREINADTAVEQSLMDAGTQASTDDSADFAKSVVMNEIQVETYMSFLKNDPLGAPVQSPGLNEFYDSKAFAWAVNEDHQRMVQFGENVIALEDPSLDSSAQLDCDMNYFINSFMANGCASGVAEKNSLQVSITLMVNAATTPKAKPTMVPATTALSYRDKSDSMISVEAIHGSERSAPSAHSARKKRFLTSKEVAKLNPILKPYGVHLENLSRADFEKNVIARVHTPARLDLIMSKIPPESEFTVLRSDPDHPFIHFSRLHASCPSLKSVRDELVLKISGGRIESGVYTMTGEALPVVSIKDCVVSDPQNQFPATFDSIYDPFVSPL